jgi:hypothetical protein
MRTVAVKRNKRQTPELLKPLMARVNLLRLNIGLPSPEYFAGPEGVLTESSRLRDYYLLVLAHALEGDDSPNDGGLFVEVWASNTNSALNAIINGLPENLQEGFKQYIWDKATALPDGLGGIAPTGENFPKLNIRADVLRLWQDVVRATLKYEEFFRIHKQFQYLTFLAEDFRLSRRGTKGDHPRLDSNVQQLTKVLSRVPNDSHLRRLFDSTEFILGLDGVLHVKHDELLVAISGEDITRIRECKSCHKVFWVERSDAVCCSSTCRKRYHSLQSYYRGVKEGLDWRKEKRLRARERANLELKLLGCTADELKAYQALYRRYPRTLITSWLENQVDRNHKIGTHDELAYFVQNVRIPENLLQPLKDFAFSLRQPAKRRKRQ